MGICTAAQAVKEAAKWVGYLEKKSGSQLDSFTANAGYNNYTIFSKVMHDAYPKTMDYPAAWCDAFVDYCIYEACGRSIKDCSTVLCGEPDDYTVNSSDMFKRLKRWGDAPKVGAQVFFTNNGKQSGICHTGIVEKFDGSTVTTIEGNTSNASGLVSNGGCVARKTYSRSSSRIAGYGYPKYSESGSQDNTGSGKGKKSVAEIAKEVINGLWGVGAVRKSKLKKAGYDYDTVQAEVNKQLGANNSPKKPASTSVEKFPLPSGHWYGTPSSNAKNHSGYYDAGERLAIKKIQAKVGVANDGYYGEKTKAAVVKWQRNHGLDPDGLVGAKTWGAMFG